MLYRQNQAPKDFWTFFEPYHQTIRNAETYHLAQYIGISIH